MPVTYRAVNLAEKRKAVGMTQAELANRSRYTKAMIGHLECGRSGASIAGALAVVKALGCTLDEVFVKDQTRQGHRTDLEQS